MKAAQAQFLKFLRTGEQFIIPIYQRTYSWETPQCEQLWNDIVHAATDDSVSGHFVGSVVYVEAGIYHVSGINQLLVIDGQQRLTTLTLLLTALAEYLRPTGPASGVTAEQITDHYLLNLHNHGEGRHRLLLTQSDRDTLIRLVDGLEAPEPVSRRILANYDFFKQKIERSGLDPAAIFHGLQKLVIVDISLDRTHDNPQLIFESLNSTGLELSQADLIRNYVLMGQAPGDMEALYRDYWFPMEQRFGHAEYTDLFDRFVRDYLTLRTRRIPNIREVYKAFKAHVQASNASIPVLVADIARFSRYFVDIALEQEKDPELRDAVKDINTLRVDVAYPFLLEMYEHYAAGRLDRSGLLQILRLVESYVLRRVICGIPTNTLNKTFATLAQSLQPSTLVESLQAAFLRMDSYRRFPTDEEFIRESVTKDIYNLRTRNYVLRKLENAQHKDRVIIENYTIEHILPQNPNLSPEWQAELGPEWQAVQARCLHTIGNLTLTLYNSAMSDKPFLEKQNMDGGFRKTPLALNDGLRDLDHWNEAAISKRAAGFAQLAATIWPAPHLPAAVLATYRAKAQPADDGMYTLADHPNLTGPMLELFEHLRMYILNLDSSVTEHIGKHYITYSTASDFVTVVPQRSQLRLTLNLRYEELYDPTGRARDVTGSDYWGEGDAVVPLWREDQIEDVMFLVLQAFDKQREGADV
jgi:uncharacterized protein with ParB-like and HNH nuclease domain/predicted transport protein